MTIQNTQYKGQTPDLGSCTNQSHSVFLWMTLYVRSILEQSCQVWHSSLTLENSEDLERIQKNALKIILQDEYENYSHALALSGLKSLNERRKELCKRFAKACTKNDQTRSMFPLNPNKYDIQTRSEKYSKLQHAILKD